MKYLLNKFTEKEFVQNILVELVGDILMITMGIAGGYFIKVALM